ncbi:MAG: hypothetical protein R6U32_00985 [Candidatus Woesearchaeota archaeon]
MDLESVERDNEVKPDEKLSIDFEVENEGDDEIEDVEVLVYFERNGNRMEDDEGDDIEFDFDLGDIDDGDSEKVDFSFNIPFDVKDDDEYYVVVEIEGKNSSSGDKIEIIDDTADRFEIIKERHELLFHKLDISPTTMDCDRMLDVHYDIRNIGRYDEDVNLSLVNSLLGINITENFNLDYKYDEDNKWEESHTIAIPYDVQSGTYALTINLYYDDGDEHKYNTTRIKIEDCGTAGEGEDSQENGEDESGEENTSSPDDGSDGTTDGSGGEETGQDTGGSTTPPPSSYSSPVKPKDESGTDPLLILIILGEVAIALLVIIITVVLIRKK